MSAVVIGLSHRTMPLDLFERFALDASRLPKAVAAVAAGSDQAMSPAVPANPAPSATLAP